MEQSLAHLYSVKADLNHSHTPVSLGAATIIHTHTKDQITDFAHTHSNDDLISITWGKVTGKPTTLLEYGITDAINTNQIVTTATANKLLLLNKDGELPTNITGTAMKAYNVDWSGVSTKPTTASGYGISDVYTKKEVDNQSIINALVFG